jgi:hypothetical protein
MHTHHITEREKEKHFSNEVKKKKCKNFVQKKKAFFCVSWWLANHSKEGYHIKN